MDTVLTTILPNDDPRSEQLQRNLRHLLALELDSASFLDGTVTFNAFKAFVLKHGSPDGVTKQLDSMTPAELGPDDQIAFRRGICLGVDDCLLADRWQNASVDSWAVIHLRGAETLSFATKGRVDDQGLDRYRRIEVDPTDRERNLTVEEAPDSKISAPDIDTLVARFNLSKDAVLVLDGSLSGAAAQPAGILVFEEQWDEPVLWFDS
jgi:hypothetical protein